MPIKQVFKTIRPDEARFLFITDLHLASFNPGAWIGELSYQETMFISLMQALKYAKHIQADALLVGGDVFHTRQLTQNPPAFINRVIRAFQEIGRAHV